LAYPYTRRIQGEAGRRRVINREVEKQDMLPLLVLQHEQVLVLEKLE
jgi:hypothetical protein